jgi:8-amino-7-oxononanoate synthase
LNAGGTPALPGNNDFADLRLPAFLLVNRKSQVVTYPAVNSLDAELQRRLEALRSQALYRELRRIDSAQSTRIRLGEAELLNFSSNDYLGLANHPALKHAAIDAIEEFGAGSGASRLISGSLKPHHQLDEAIARFKGAEAALSFSSGYTTALGTIPALLTKDDVVIVDKLVHACIVDAARLSGARLRVFSHNDLDELEDILKWAVSHRGTGSSRTLIVTESVFSMDGDQAPLREIAALKESYGAWLMVDEAHATGLYGERRRGLAEELRVSDRIEIQMGTMGKTLGSAGGFICGSRTLIDYLVNRARSFIFSTAPPPAAAAAALAAIRIVESAEGELLRQTVRVRSNEFRTQLDGRAFQPFSTIVPVIIGDETAACDAAQHLRARGLFVPAIRYPTVARGTARLRVSINASHSSAEITTLADEIRGILDSNRK